MLLVLGVELLPVPEVLFGVEVELGLVELVPLMSGLLELGEVELGEVELGEVVSVELLLLGLDGEVEFMSELLDPVVDDGEVEVLEPVGLELVEGVL
ncbi:MAG TPA: hypothetical protein VGL89_14455 [Candidatus Koribacter sp.]